MQAFFNRLIQDINADNRPIINMIDITVSSNKNILNQIPDALVKETEFKLATFDIPTLEILKTKAFYLTFASATELFPSNTRENIYTNLISTFKKFSHLKEVAFECEINHQILQGVASVPSVKKIILCCPIEKIDEKSIRKYINVLKVLGNIDELTFFNNKEFCDELIAHEHMETANLKFRLLSEEGVLYDSTKHNKQASKKRKLQQIDGKSAFPSPKRQRISPNLFTNETENQKDESDDDDDVDITPEMTPRTQAFMRN